MVTSVLPEGYKYLIEDEKFCSPTNYECNLRIRGMKTEEEAKKWLETLNELSLVTWKVLRTYPKSGKINVYKGEFRCQHRVHGKRKDLKKSKNTNCPARLRVCIRRYLKSTNAKAPDPLTKLWPCIIELKNIHNHCVESADSLQYRPVNEATRKRVSELFQQGHSPHSAAEALKLDLLIESPETYEDRENDASYCPFPSFCYREYARIYGHSYRGRQKNSVQMELESLLGPYINDAEGGRAVISLVSDRLVVCLCTPIMQRIHRLVPESRSIIHLQIFGHPDKKYKVFLFTTWIQIGEVPLSVIMTDTEAQEVFTTGLQLLKTILPTGAFFGAGWPELFVMPDDDIRRKDAMAQEFPQSLILTSKDYQQKRFQDFLLDPKNKISKPLYSDLFKRFKVMLNSTSDEDFVSNFEKASSIIKPDDEADAAETNSRVLPPTLELSQLMNLFWTESNGFSNVFRPGLFATPLENPASEGVQILSHLLLTSIFDRVKNYNLVQLSQFIISTFEKFMRNRLTSSTYVESLLKIFLPTKGAVNFQKMKKLEESFFEVPTEGAMELVEMNLLHCTCPAPRICSHHSAVIQKYYSATIPYPFHLQEFYIDLAGGKEICGGNVGKHVPPVLLLPKQARVPPSHEMKKDEEVVEGEALIGQINQWLSYHLNQNPARFVPALKSMVRNMDLIGTDHEVHSAVAGFGSGYKPIRIGSELQSSPPPLVLPTRPPPLLPATQEVSFITTLGTEAEEILGGIPNATYLPLQEIPGEDGAPGYFILVTDEKGIFTTQDQEDEIVETITIEEETYIPEEPLIVKRKPQKRQLKKRLLGI